MGRFFVGTSGFSYSHWGNGLFYPKDLPQAKWFEYYVKHFNSVELNVSFYRLPKKEVFAGWRAKADEAAARLSRDPVKCEAPRDFAGGRKKAGPPDGGFVFSVKGSRYITHVKKLKDCQEAVERFFEAAGGLKGGADVVLWQLPPRLAFDKLRLKEFLTILPRTFRYAFEFRHDSWLNDEVFELLKSFKSAVVFQDFPDWPIASDATADFIYLRFHGKTSLYSSCYTERELTGWAKKIKSWLKKGLDCYAFFNNDALGYAVENAKELKKLLYETAQT